jgi:hypothetical protein
MPRILILISIALLAAGCATHAVTSGRVAVRDDRASIEVGFSSRDRALIEEHYRGVKPGKKTPPGLAKREQLPPGLAKREQLPPGLQGKMLPRDLESRLTVLPSAYMRLIVGHDVVLMNRNTRVVLDILYGVAVE